jgi:anti-anti-sigma regulatory factor
MPVMNVTLGDLSYTLGIGPSSSFLRLAGNLCGSNTSKLSSIMQRALVHVQGRLFLSLQGCHTIDSQALALLARQRAALGERCDVVLVDVPAQLQKVLEGSHIAALFEIMPSLQDAEKKYGHAVC